ncbi:MAG TPA: biopolymer transporter ExbD [Tichowtungia sp.]|nr:biopolymer transporter ExbD [Tichowtungia sp.]
MKLNLVEDVDVDIDMSPMIDMVFLLLIFFIAASAVVQLDKPDVTLPSASAAKVPDEITGRMNISMDTAEQLYIGSKPVSEDEFKTALAKEVAADPAVRVFIRSDANVPYRVNKKLMQLCADVGAVNLIYAAFEE